MKTHVPELVGCRRNSSKREIHSNKRLHLVQFSSSVMSDSLRPHEPQHAKPLCTSPTPRVYSNSCPLSWWCQPTISSSVVPLSSLLQSFPASGSFQMSQLIASGGQSTGVSASNEYSGLISFSMDWLDLLAAQGTLKSLLQNNSSKSSILQPSAFCIGEGNGNPLQYYCLENPRDRGEWKSWLITQYSKN